MNIRTYSTWTTTAARLAGLAFLFAVLALPLQSNAEEHPVGIENTDEAGTEAYWTPERLQSAQPMPLPSVSGAPQATAPESPPAGSLGMPGAPPTEQVQPNDERQLFTPTNQGGQSQEDDSSVGKMVISGSAFTSARLVSSAAAGLGTEKTYPYNISGKLFFTVPSTATGCTKAGNYVCSATVQRPGIILTAGHCTNDGNGHFYTNWMFAPAYRNGKAPFGTWVQKWTEVTGTWNTGGCSLPNDQDDAVIVLNKNKSGQLVGNLTGFAGFQPVDLYSGQHVTVIGYPNNLDGGAIDHRTDAQASGGGGNTNEIGGDAGPGSSGGGWFVNYGQYASGQPVAGVGVSDTNATALIAATSYGPMGTVGYLGASVLDDRYVSCLPLKTCSGGSNSAGILNFVCFKFPGWC